MLRWHIGCAWTKLIFGGEPYHPTASDNGDPQRQRQSGGQLCPEGRRRILVPEGDVRIGKTVEYHHVYASQHYEDHLELERQIDDIFCRGRNEHQRTRDYRDQKAAPDPRKNVFRNRRDGALFPGQSQYPQIKHSDRTNHQSDRDDVDRFNCGK